MSKRFYLTNWLNLIQCYQSGSLGLEPHHQMHFNIISKTLISRGANLLRRRTSQLELQNTPTANHQRGKTFSTSLLDMIFNNLMALVILEVSWMQSSSLLPMLPGRLRRGVVAPHRVLSMGKIELNCLFMLNWVIWNRTVLTFNYE